MVVTKENFHHMSRLVRYAEEVGIDYLDFTIFNLAAVTNIEASYYEFYKSTEFLDAVSELESTIRDTKKITVTNKNFETEKGFQKCPFPWTHFYICWDGFVPPCCAKPFPKELKWGSGLPRHMWQHLSVPQGMLDDRTAYRAWTDSDQWICPWTGTHDFGVDYAGRIIKDAIELWPGRRKVYQ